jgi:hypothetical protein
VVTYEHHTDKEDFDLQPGDNITLNWGISQFVPLTSDQQLLLEIGPAGYQSFQVSAIAAATLAATTATARTPPAVSSASRRWRGIVAVNFHGFVEYETRSRRRVIRSG